MFAGSTNLPVQEKFNLHKISPRSLPKRKFTEDDDRRLTSIVNRLGTRSWTVISKEMGDRNPRQCKERWETYLNPDINNNPWTKEEDQLLLQKQKEIGSKWVIISQFFDRRTDAAVKNRWQLLERKIKKSLLLKQTTQTPVIYSRVEPIQAPKQEKQDQDFFQIDEFVQPISSPEEDYFAEWDIYVGEADQMFNSLTF
jgi:hypothetical protein